MAAARAGDFTIQPDGRVDLAGVTLAADEVEILATPRPGTAVAHDEGLVVVIDTDADPGAARRGRRPRAPARDPGPPARGRARARRPDRASGSSRARPPWRRYLDGRRRRDPGRSGSRRTGPRRGLGDRGRARRRDRPARLAPRRGRRLGCDIEEREPGGTDLDQTSAGPPRPVAPPGSADAPAGPKPGTASGPVGASADDRSGSSSSGSRSGSSSSTRSTKAWVVGLDRPDRQRSGSSATTSGSSTRATTARCSGCSAAAAPILALTSLVVIGLIFVYHARSGRSPLLSIALGLLLGGALGNLIDRVHYGYVVDFVDMGLGTPAVLDVQPGRRGDRHGHPAAGRPRPVAVAAGRDGGRVPGRAGRDA